MPEGSSLGRVRITAGSLELEEVKLVLPDGGRLRLSRLDTEFKPLAALLERTLVTGPLLIDGLVVEVPGRVLPERELASAPAISRPSVASAGAGSATGSADPAIGVEAAAPASSGANGMSPLDALYAFGQLDYLFDIDSIKMTGELRDGGGNEFVLELVSGAIRPGSDSEFEASLELRSEADIQAGLRTFNVSARGSLSQNIDGGFEEFRLESVSNGSDAAGHSLLSVTQEVALSVNGFEEVAALEASFRADVPKPEVLWADAGEIGALLVEGAVSAAADGARTVVSGADFSASVGGRKVLVVDLLKTFAFGGGAADADLSGELMHLQVSDFPLTWLRPWVPAGYGLEGADLNASFSLLGVSEGVFEVRTLDALALGPLSVSRDGRALVEDVSVRCQPTARLAEGGAISWASGDIAVSDRYGKILSGELRGSFDGSVVQSGLMPKGLRAEGDFDVGLAQALQQPVFDARTSVMAGRAMLDVDFASEAEYPLKSRVCWRG